MNEELQNNSNEDGVQDWSRRNFIIGASSLFAVGVAALAADTSIGRALNRIGGPKIEQGLVHVNEGDYYFAPNHMTWRVGDQITIHQENQSPYRYHEMMIGRGFDSVPGLLGDIRQQFHTDFWDGVHVTIIDAHGADNWTTNKAIVHSNVAKGPWLDTNPADGNFSPTLVPGGWVEYRFTVPDKVGRWMYGCFVQGFIHYEEGMRGTIDILPRV